MATSQGGGGSGVARVHAGNEGHPPLPARPQRPHPPTHPEAEPAQCAAGGGGEREWAGRTGRGSGGKAPGPRLRAACRSVLSLFDFLSEEPVLGAGWFPRKHVVRLFPAAAFPPPAAASATARRSAPSGEHRAGRPRGP